MALDRCGWSTPQPLHLGNMLSTHCTGGQVGPRAAVDGCGEAKSSCLYRGLNPKMSSL
jgi:hypothetical protein